MGKPTKATAPEPDAVLEHGSAKHEIIKAKKPSKKPAKTDVIQDTANLMPQPQTDTQSIPEVVEPVTLAPRHRLRRAVMAGSAALILLAAIWTGASYMFARTVVAGESLPNRSSRQAFESAFARHGEAARITISRPDKQKQAYTLADIGLRVDEGASVNQLRDWQHGFMGRLIWWRPITAVAIIRTDEKKLNAFIDDKTTIIAQPSKDAVISLQDGTVTVADSVTGKQFGLPNSRQALIANAAHLGNSTLQMRQLAINPAVTTASLQPYKKQLEAMLSQNITFTMNGRVVTAEPTDIADWLDLSSDAKTGKVTIATNSGKVAAYVDSITKRYVREAKSQVEVAGQDGQPNRVLVAGADGVAVMNKSAVSAAVADAVKQAKGSDQQLDITVQPYTTVTAGSYAKWIEVNVTTKQMYLYEHDTLVRQEPISAGAPDTPTVLGQYKIYAKYTQQDMRGNNVDGSRYFQPNVRWISYFYRDYAVHGNYWRPLDWFGRINSSHGCVSLPNAQAKEVYDWTTIGTPVIVHT